MNFIIYEDEEKFSEGYKATIFRIMSNSKENYHTYEFNKWDETESKKIKDIKGNKIYIMDIEVPGKNGIDLAREIRQSGDWTSPIIIVTSHEEFKIVGYTSKILMLDFITKDDVLAKNLYDALKVALQINSCKKCLSFHNKGELHHLPYEDILYIEKSLNDNSSVVVTKYGNYTIRKSIVHLAEELEEIFFKTHRSCLVNLDNVKHVDFDNNIISFGHITTDLLSRSHKKSLKNMLEREYE
ncbi:MAG: response regulator transcription factor [Bacilli bacterium]|nr:response regulator transcription factor [Bacilli bacterium]